MEDNTTGLIQEIRSLCTQDRIVWTHHVQLRMLQRKISRGEVKAAILCGELIEYYPESYPYPGGLFFHSGTSTGPLHVVCGKAECELWIITAYRPDAESWMPDQKTRK